MALYEVGADALTPLVSTTLKSEKIRERQDLQRLIRDQIEVLDPDLLVISEEFGEWDASRRRIDLLALDRAANLVVIELKRDEVGGHMELQALRYAAMVSTMTFEQSVGVFGDYLTRRGRTVQDARDTILEFLDWEDADEDAFAQDVRIVLASSDFGIEITTAVLWLNDRDLDVRCIRLRPYTDGKRVLLNVEQVIPLPEAEEFQVRLREKSRQERRSRGHSRDLTRYDVEVFGAVAKNQSKRQAIFAMVKGVADSGPGPEEITTTALSRPFDHTWVVVQGDVTEDDFHPLAVEARKVLGRSYDPGRWFTADSELVQHDGRTYAFTKMWGGETWRQAMEGLKQGFPAAAISFVPAASE
jgi:hypothetical protein